LHWACHSSKWRRARTAVSATIWLDQFVEKTIDLTLVPVRGSAVNVEAYVQDIDVAVEAQRNLQRLIQD
jgi:hypothetical protein